MPPASPIPGCSSGDVCSDSTHTRLGVAEAPTIRCPLTGPFLARRRPIHPPGGHGPGRIRQALAAVFAPRSSLAALSARPGTPSTTARASALPGTIWITKPIAQDLQDTARPTVAYLAAPINPGRAPASRLN